MSNIKSKFRKAADKNIKVTTEAVKGAVNNVTNNAADTAKTAMSITAKAVDHTIKEASKATKAVNKSPSKKASKTVSKTSRIVDKNIAKATKISHNKASNAFRKNMEKLEGSKKYSEETWLFGNIIDSNPLNKMQQYMHNMVNLASSAVNNATNSKAEQTINNVNSNINNSIEENMKLGQEFLKCRTASDTLELQKKIFELNFSNMFKLCTDLSYAYQNIASEYFKHYSDKNIKRFNH